MDAVEVSVQQAVERVTVAALGGEDEVGVIGARRHRLRIAAEPLTIASVLVASAALALAYPSMSARM
jgi:hypothetical protein